MQAITTIGLDIAKSVFQVHGIDVEGKVVIRRHLKRRHGHSNINAGANPIAFSISKQYLNHSKIIDILREAYELA
jgi:hypothetical protein